MKNKGSELTFHLNTFNCSSANLFCPCSFLRCLVNIVVVIIHLVMSFGDRNEAC